MVLLPPGQRVGIALELMELMSTKHLLALSEGRCVSCTMLKVVSNFCPSANQA